ncbi:MAG: HEAT repeat domain-containing protein [Polyangiaceae bacterium]
MGAGRFGGRVGVRTLGLAGLACLGGLVLLASAGGCAASTGARLADRGDYIGLRDAMAARQRAGDLSNDEAASIARSVVAEQIRSAPAADAEARIRDVWACAHEVDSALAARMKVHDGAGAQAALARVDARGLGLDDVHRFASDADPEWRSVGARSLVGDGDRDARLRAIVDPSPLVRRQAMRAARDAADPRDAAALAEAARLDPEPIVRTEAVRALAALPSSAAPVATAGVDVPTILRDLWTSAPAGDDGLREDIAIAWGMLWASGGREALRVAVASGRGPGAIEGAAVVLRRADADAEMVGIASGVLARAIDGGSRSERLQAIAEAPLDGRHGQTLLARVEQAASDGDLEVRVSALSRLAASGGVSVVAQLEGLAQPGSPVASQARFALAGAGDRRIQGWIEQDLVAARPESRVLAANALTTLGLAARAAPLLADSDASVRMRAACTIVAGARFRR